MGKKKSVSSDANKNTVNERTQNTTVQPYPIVKNADDKQRWKAVYISLRRIMKDITSQYKKTYKKTHGKTPEKRNILAFKQAMKSEFFDPKHTQQIFDEAKAAEAKDLKPDESMPPPKKIRRKKTPHPTSASSLKPAHY